MFASTVHNIETENINRIKVIKHALEIVTAITFDFDRSITEYML